MRELALGRLERVKEQSRRPAVIERLTPEAAPRWDHEQPDTTGVAIRRRIIIAVAIGLGLLAAIAGVLLTRPHAHANRAAGIQQLTRGDGPVTVDAAAEGLVYGPPIPSLSSDEAVDRVLQALKGDEADSAAPGAYADSTRGDAPPSAASPSAAATGWSRGGVQAEAAGQVAAAPPPVSDGWTKLGDNGTRVTMPVVAPVPSAGTAPIIWPASGPITSYFGPSHPLGIDIGIPQGTPLRAVADGRIAFVGGDACCSYGYYVDLDHGNGVTTRYGHMMYIPAIQVGTRVRQGDIIGLSGNTGFSTGPHVHFEIRLFGRVVDPLRVLPGGSSR